MKIAVLTSGGVDSALALHLLKKEGHDVTACYLKIWLEDELSFLGECPWEDDLEWIHKICQQQDVPLEVIPMQQEYRTRIINYTISEARAGRTPNPDLLCNQHIKFGAFYELIAHQFEKIGSGHYARVEADHDRFLLKTAPDSIKDQTYFLSHLSQEQLSRALFPLGHFNKAQVRTLANKFQLPNSNRPDSQGLCFLGKISFRDFLRYHLGERPGFFVEIESGAIVGEHRGFWFYTIGQRRGLELAEGPWFVCDKNIDENVVYVSRNYYSMDKSRLEFTVTSPHWITTPPADGYKLKIKLRHGPRINHCTLETLGKERLLVKLEERDQGIAPGQFAVFYDNDICLGCAVIENETGSIWEKTSTYHPSISLT